jgi:uncharacterized protein (TIGR02145 family)
MKFFLRTSAICLLLLSIITIVKSCRKDDYETGKFRDKYLGTWYFKYHYYKKAQPFGLSISDSSSYTGVINYGPKYNQLLIQYAENNYLLKNVESDGTILNECGGSSWNNDCSGYFDGDTVFYYTTYIRTNSSLTQTSVFGRKIDKGNSLNDKPSASTVYAAGGLNEAILYGIVNPNYLATTVSFEYGFTSNYTSTIFATEKTIFGCQNINVNANLAELIPGTKYHFRVKASNSLGVAYGNDMVFSTLNTAGIIADIDQNKYQTVTIGDQIWMAENLKVTRYNDGVSIPNITDNNAWIELNTPSFSWYNNDSGNKTPYGPLYNWFAVDNDKLCPEGWHVPDKTEWVTLFTFLGGLEIAGGKLKEAGTLRWQYNPGSTNESGFTAIPGGSRSYNQGSFSGMNFAGIWWMRNEADLNTAKAFSILSSSPSVNIWADNAYKQYGFSVRCLKGDPPVRDTLPAVYTSEVTEIDLNSAVCGGTITNDGGHRVTARGICWSTSQNPTISDNNTSDGTGTGNYSSKLINLTENSTYYVRAYATNDAGTSYGKQHSFTTPFTFNDIDGNMYKALFIGTQIWMNENLNTSRYNDGTSIPNITVNATWGKLTTDAFCNYDNNPSNSDIYGKLYNWFAVNTGKLCPAGWHVPSDEEWTILVNYLGGQDAAGGKLKEAGIMHWQSPNTGATNESGFTALPGGYRFYDTGSFVYLGSYGLWWSSTESEYSSTGARLRSLYYNLSSCGRDHNYKTLGMSVRCIKDK